MRSGGRHRWEYAICGAGVAVGFALLPLGAEASGTAASQSTSRSFFDRIFGGKSSTSQPQQAPANTPSNITCPKVEIRSGTETAAVYERPTETTPLNLRYQVTIGELARECLKSGDLGTVKLGVAGRVILGPKGSAGNYVVPLRIAVLKGGTDQVYSNLVKLPVTIAQGQSSTPFSYVAEDVTFPVEANDRLSRYLIYVGFDQGAPKKPR